MINLIITLTNTVYRHMESGEVIINRKPVLVTLKSGAEFTLLRTDSLELP